MAQVFDIAIIGAGIAGASVAARLAQAGRRVALLEMESQPGYHTTGRSAAVFAPSYGPASMRALTRASDAFFRAPPEGFAQRPLISPRKIMMIARNDQQAALHSLVETVQGDQISVIDAAAARAENPLLREGYAQSAMLDHAGQDIDVGTLQQGFLRMMTAAGGVLQTRAEVTGLSFDGVWSIETGSGALKADIIVNAAGAWADTLGQMAGAGSIGLTPKRRTGLLVPQPGGLAIGDAPITIDIDDQFYLKPDAGQLLISPADETPSAPCDAQPEELDVAICVDRIETAFDLQVRKVSGKWAGLRSFTRDGAPVVGFSAKAAQFYWLAGQGGYGIQSAPALSDYAAAQILDLAAPHYIVDQGLEPSQITVARL